jgi:hypothetical protein
MLSKLIFETFYSVRLKFESCHHWPRSLSWRRRGKQLSVNDGIKFHKYNKYFQELNDDLGWYLLLVIYLLGQNKVSYLMLLIG